MVWFGDYILNDFYGFAGKFVVNFKNEDAEPRKLKIKSRVNMHGIFAISSATIYEKVEIDEEEPAEEAMETEPQQTAPATADAPDPANPSDSQEPDLTESTDSMDNSESTDANATDVMV